MCVRDQWPECVVRTQQLQVAYPGGPLVLGGIDFEMLSGEVVALLGSSGSGKSTLMKALTGFAPITGGSAHVVGRDVVGLRSGDLRQLRADVGQVCQQFNLIGRLSVLTNVLTGALPAAGPVNLVGGFGGDHRRRALELLDRVGIVHKATAEARTLSGGQQQRVAIVRALMQQPRLILADDQWLHSTRVSPTRSWSCCGRSRSLTVSPCSSVFTCCPSPNATAIGSSD